jgi:hypothetical protein
LEYFLPPPPVTPGGAEELWVFPRPPPAKTDVPIIMQNTKMEKVLITSSSNKLSIITYVIIISVSFIPKNGGYSPLKAIKH